MTRPLPDPVRGAETARKLRALGVKGDVIKAAVDGYITELACAMPKCFCPEELGGARYFAPRTKEWNDWEPTFEHFPIAKREGGRRTSDNAVLAHRLCNKFDHFIRDGLPIDKDLARVRRAREEVVSERTDLLLTIARCPIVEQCLTSPSPTHPCSTIAFYQWPDDVPFEQRLERWQSEHHVPEPWVGHLESAPLLFLSSNPSLAPSGRHKPGPPGAKARPLERLGEHTAEDHPSLRRGLSAPKWDWEDEQIVDRVTSAFDVFMNAEGTANIKESGAPDKVVPYWRDIRKLADHLYGRPTKPAQDYALTEAVRCKSPREIGVGSAAKECVPRYLQRTLALSPARVICVVGRVARMAIRDTYSYPDARQVSEPMEIEGRERLVVFVSAPSAYAGKLAYPKTVPDDAVGVVRDWLP